MATSSIPLRLTAVTGTRGKPRSEPAGILRHRADIDGLRAVAVLAVLGYHLKVGAFRGGFVGVDIFFVISGYLIAGIILKDLVAGHFSIASFYERRVRRILPALIVALAGTGLLAYFYLLPVELTGFAKSLLAATFSSSNFYFWKHSSYFSAPVETKPLIHTWSLAVEEQFYLFLPVFLALGHRYFRRGLRLVTILIALVSLAVSSVGAFQAPTATFYLPHARAWELLLGVLISMELFPEITRPFLREVAAAFGVVLIGVAVFELSPNTPFPGVAALLPCVGAALIVAAGRTGPSFVGRLLSLKPVAFVGLISYSLYLWHWPIIVFQGMESWMLSGVSVRMAKLIITLVSFAIATLSWKFVELPFRAGRMRLPRKALFQTAAIATAVIAAAGTLAIGSGGFPSRYPTKAIQVASYLDYDSGKYFRDGTCFISSEYKYSDYDVSKCLQTRTGQKNYLLFGDSHAAQLWYGLSTNLAGVNLLQATASGCKPTLEQNLLASDTCKQLMNFIYRDYVPNHKVDRILIAARWQEEDLVPLSRSLEWLKGRGTPVVLFGPMVQYDMALPRLLAFSIRGNDRMMPDEHRIDQRGLDNALSSMAAKIGVEYVSFYRSLCGAGSCEKFGVDGVPLQFDYGHLTKEGSVLVAQKVLQSGELR